MKNTVSHKTFGVIGLLSFYFINFFIISCQNLEDKNIKIEEERKIQLMALAYVRDSGNCLRIEQISNDSKNIYCNRIPLGLCNIEARLIYSSSEKTQRTVGLNDLIKKFPKCQNLILLSGLLREAITTKSEKENIYSKNRFESISSCEDIGFSSSLPVASKEEILFLESYRGGLGKSVDSKANSTASPLNPQSEIDEAKECLNQLYSPLERSVLESIRKKEKLAQYSCQTGASNSSSPCDKNW